MSCQTNIATFTTTRYNFALIADKFLYNVCLSFLSWQLALENIFVSVALQIVQNGNRSKICNTKIDPISWFYELLIIHVLLQL